MKPLTSEQCMNQCNNAQTCGGIGFIGGPFPKCYLFDEIWDTPVRDSGCKKDVWGLRVYRKKVDWTWTDSLMMKGGLETIWPGKTNLKSFGYCEDFSISFLWRWWTYQFTHGSITHVGSNCLMTFILGIPLEGWHGTGYFAVMWTVGVLGGAFCWALFDPYVTSYGASGGCYSLLGMHAADLILNWGDKKWRWGEITVMLFVAGVESLLYWTTRDEESSTAHTVHVGGLIAGLLIGFCTGNNAHVKIWEYVCIGCGWFLGFGIVIATLVIWYGSPLNDNEAPAIGSLWDLKERPFCWIGTVCVDNFGGHCPLIDSDSAYAPNSDLASNGKGGIYNTMYQCVMCQTRDCVEGWWKDTYDVTHSDGITVTSHYKYCPQDSTRDHCPFNIDDGFDVWYPPTKSTYS
jgi:membrane associated rhomboid family serine protease